MNCNASSYIENLYDTHKHEPRIIAGAEIDYNISTDKAVFRRETVQYGILSYHGNGPFNLDEFIKLVDELKPNTIGHPFRYIEK